jgi:hypothetical protein
MHRLEASAHLYELKVQDRQVEMRRMEKETLGVRYTGRAALDRDPLEDKLEYVCPFCGVPGAKSARRPRAAYHFTDGFIQDLQGEVCTCRSCRNSFRVVPVVLLHDQGEKRRFREVFEPELVPSVN